MAERKEEVVDIKVESNKIFKSIERKRNMDIDGIIKKAIEGVTEKRYTSKHGNRVESSTQEGGDHGII